MRLHSATLASLLLAGAMSAPLALSPAFAAELSVPLHAVTATGVGAAIGTARLTDADGGLKITLDITGGGLSDGLHGFHVHQNPSCEAAMTDGKMTAAAAAGGHLDPMNTGHHLGPSATGHLGDLPAISITGGKAMGQLLWAPALSVEKVRGHALMIHEGSDNYRDDPKPLGGGGARAVCGVVPAA